MISRTLIQCASLGLFLCASATSQAATLLNVGDISFVGYSSTGTDQIAFVSWVNLDATTTISFTDRGWRTSTNAFTQNPSEDPANAPLNLVPSDGNVVWTSGVAIPAGTIIIATVQNNNPDTAIWNIGISTGDFGNTGLSSVGESLFAYQGSKSAPALLTGLYYNDSAWSAVDPGQYSTTPSQLPLVLNNAIGNIAVPSSTAVKENGYYSGSFTNQGNLLDYRAQVLNRANWTVSTTDPTDNLAGQFPTNKFTTAPEPSAAIFGLLGLVGLARRRRN
ncbi:MAG: exported protein of unknown function [Akkermansiaceae bacterium]|nr:exported protein of unknown function [Akkermansiaceae bacterium]